MSLSRWMMRSYSPCLKACSLLMLASHVVSPWSFSGRLSVYISVGLSLTRYLSLARTKSCDIRSLLEETSRSQVLG